MKTTSEMPDDMIRHLGNWLDKFRADEQRQESVRFIDTAIREGGYGLEEVRYIGRSRLEYLGQTGAVYYR